MSPADLTGRPDFRLLWSGTTVGLLGMRVGGIAIPLLAVHSLGASALDMGVLTAAPALAALVVGLPAGAVVDRVDRRRLLIAMDVVRGLVLLSAAVAAAAGTLTFAYLVVVATAVGLAAVFSELAQLACLPALVGRDGLVAANARLQGSRSVGAAAGPGVGGAAVAAVGGTVTLVGAGLAFLASALLLGRMRPAPVTAPAQRPGLVAGMGDGLRLVFGDPVFRAIALCTGSINLFMSMVLTLAVLFLGRDVGASVGVTGLVMAALGAGGIAAAATARRWTTRFGQARSMWLVLLATQPWALLLPYGGAVPFGVGLFMVGYGNALYNVVQLSFRQERCADGVLGRMSGAMRVLAMGSVPLGGMLAGALGTWLGVRGALWLAVAGMTGSALWLLCSPLVRTEAARPAAVG